MIYELRVYHCVPGRLAALNARFANVTLKMWKKHGIRQVGFFTDYIGDNCNNKLTYILEWKSLAEREKVWNAFAADPRPTCTAWTDCRRRVPAWSASPSAQPSSA